jgi:hypothetical protein
VQFTTARGYWGQGNESATANRSVIRANPNHKTCLDAPNLIFTSRPLNNYTSIFSLPVSP